MKAAGLLLANAMMLTVSLDWLKGAVLAGLCALWMAGLRLASRPGEAGLRAPRC